MKTEHIFLPSKICVHLSAMSESSFYVIYINFSPWFPEIDKFFSDLKHISKLTLVQGLI